ncbi:MAG: DUF47 family protein [Planctomycetia bacterium]|nr:DUF47 family protein [Planctomycetia bacterium]
MRFSLIPREPKFFDMFDEAAAMLGRASNKFLELVVQFDRLSERSAELKQAEHDCDDVIERILTVLDRSFITPFDREDIHSLATSLDDVLDSMEETAYRLVVLRIDRPSQVAIDMARIIKDACSHIEHAVHLCRSIKDVATLQQHLVEIGRLENEADQLYRESEAALFASPPDILSLIKLREIYGWLEETVDSCRRVAHVISQIVIKGA